MRYLPFLLPILISSSLDNRFIYTSFQILNLQGIQAKLRAAHR